MPFHILSSLQSAVRRCRIAVARHRSSPACTEELPISEGRNSMKKDDSVVRNDVALTVWPRWDCLLFIFGVIVTWAFIARSRYKKSFAPLPRHIVFYKTFKTGSSSWGGAMRRLANKKGFVGSRWNLSPFVRILWLLDLLCTHVLFANHERYFSYIEDSALVRNSEGGLVTIVRHPSERCLSQAYHRILSREHTPKEQWDGEKEYVLNVCNNWQFEQMRNSTARNAVEVLSQFQFVATTERFDESLVLLSHLWRVPLRDLLYLRTKDSHLTKRLDEQPGIKIVPHQALAAESPAIRSKATGSDFRKRNSEDFKLWELATQKIDEEIARRGSQFDAEILQFKGMLSLVEKRCRSAFDTFTDCLWNDNGCAQGCIDWVVQEQGW